MARKLIMTISVSLMALGLGACNTVRGAGQDLQSIANDVDEAV